MDTLGCTIEKLWKSQIQGVESVDKKASDVKDSFFDAYKSIQVRLAFHSVWRLNNKALFFQAIDKPSAVQWRQFIITLHDTLSKFDDYQISLIEEWLTKSQVQLETLENSLISEYIKTWFKVCLDCI